jgi:hypothetical protein
MLTGWIAPMAVVPGCLAITVVPPLRRQLLCAETAAP